MIWKGRNAEQIAKDYPNSTHYKIAHHGASSKANKIEWLMAIKLVEAHVSHSYYSKYNHPRCEAIDRLKKVGSIGTVGGPSATTHAFTCFDNKTPKTEDIKHRIYSTAPEKDKVCLIILSFEENEEAVTNYFCDDPKDFITYELY